MDGPHGNMIHSTVPSGMVGRACHFRSIDEYWYVLSGEGEVWRRAKDGHESVTRLVPGVCIDIPLGTAFQYRCTGDAPLVFTCTAPRKVCHECFGCRNCGCFSVGWCLVVPGCR